MIGGMKGDVERVCPVRKGGKGESGRRWEGSK